MRSILNRLLQFVIDENGTEGGDPPNALSFFLRLMALLGTAVVAIIVPAVLYILIQKFRITPAFQQLIEIAFFAITSIIVIFVVVLFGCLIVMLIVFTHHAIHQNQRIVESSAKSLPPPIYTPSGYEITPDTKHWGIAQYRYNRWRHFRRWLRTAALFLLALVLFLIWYLISNNGYLPLIPAPTLP